MPPRSVKVQTRLRNVDQMGFRSLHLYNAVVITIIIIIIFIVTIIIIIIIIDMVHNFETTLKSY